MLEDAMRGNDSVVQHYDTHLARYYVWLFGGWDGNTQRARQFIADHGLGPGVSGRALDLGCGPGFYALPLAEAGFAVVAVDTSRDLLGELVSRAPGADISPVDSDMLSMIQHETNLYDLCLCMGDTIAHLGSRAEIHALVGEAYRILVPGGTFVLSFRNYDSSASRFIPVRSDDSRLAMCVLDYEEDRVQVSDVLWERTHDGWAMTASSYYKTRVSALWMEQCMQDAGFTIAGREQEQGMITLSGKKM